MIEALSLLALAGAQAAPSQPAPPQSPLIIDQGRADRLQPPPASQQTPARTTRSTAGLSRVEATGTGVPIKGIAFEGAKVPVVVGEAAKRFLGASASRETLEQLAKAMSDAYADSDVALYTVVVPDQDLSNGVVRVIVAEGFVEKIAFGDGATKQLRAYAAQLAKEKPLTRRTLERYISLMRDIPGATVDVQLLKGAKAGGVVMQIAAKRKHVDVSAGYDNLGTGQLGTSQVRATVTGYSLLRDGDRTDVTGLASPDFKRLRYIAASHTTLIGHDGLSLTASGGYLSTRPKHSTVDGDARTFGLSASYPVIRGYKRNLSATVGLDGIDSDAATFGTTFSSDHTRALRLAGGYAQTGPKSVLTVGASYSRGLDILSARGTPDFTDTRFDKVTGRVTYDRQLGKRLFIHTRATGQYSKDKLAAVERLAIGGPDFGRAFDQAILTGDRGYAGSFELALRPALPPKLAGSEIYGFVDGARVRLVERLPYAYAANYDLASAGAGIRLIHDARNSFGVEGARALDQPYAGYGEKWRVNLSWRLSLKRR
jgi:hemolysin activation/secretion protein